VKRGIFLGCIYGFVHGPAGADEGVGRAECGSGRSFCGTRADVSAAVVEGIFVANDFAVDALGAIVVVAAGFGGRRFAALAGGVSGGSVTFTL
jgi:hypothetical protein